MKKFIFLFFIFTRVAFSNNLEYFGCYLSKKNTSINKNNILLSENTKENNLVREEINKWFKNIKTLSLNGQQITKSEDGIKIGNITLQVDKIKKFAKYSFIGTKNNNDEFDIIREGNDAILLDKKTNQKTSFDRENGIEDIFLNNQEFLPFNIYYCNTKIVAILFTKDSSFGLSFKRIKENLDDKNENILNTNDEQKKVVNSILQEKNTNLKLDGIAMHYDQTHSEIIIENINTNNSDTNQDKNTTQNKVLDKRLQDE